MWFLMVINLHQIQRPRLRSSQEADVKGAIFLTSRPCILKTATSEDKGYRAWS